MDGPDVERWFAEYLAAFEACGRGERETGSLLAYYGVPMLATTDAGFFALTSAEAVIGAVQQQISAMRDAVYDHTATLDAEVEVLNATSALYRATFSRRRADGSEVSRLTASYLVTDGAPGRRISVLAVHSA